MNSIFNLLLQIIFIILLLTGITLVPLGFPGTWLIFIDALLYSLVRDFESRDLMVLFLTGLMAVLGELIEFVSGIYGAKKVKVPNGAIIASFIGGLIGVIVGVPVFLIGSLLGLLLGTYLGAFLYSVLKQSSSKEAFSVAQAVLFSRIIALFAKTLIAVIMSIYLLTQIF